MNVFNKNFFSYNHREQERNRVNVKINEIGNRKILIHQHNSSMLYLLNVQAKYYIECRQCIVIKLKINAKL